MKTNEELLKMSHNELMESTQEIRNQFKEAFHLDFSNKVELGVKLGYKHIQMHCGCIKVRKNANGIFYSTRNGLGNGKDNYTSESLKDCIDHLKGCGWGNEVTYK